MKSTNYLSSLTASVVQDTFPNGLWKHRRHALCPGNRQRTRTSETTHCSVLAAKKRQVHTFNNNGRLTWAIDTKWRLAMNT